ncbi:hypothetical protein B0H13DRAFT_1920390 [Mycena leptocephala]|nr:hypothetical protein B0H13DRAFT_1920390 [Mycena leptocephala]
MHIFRATARWAFVVLQLRRPPSDRCGSDISADAVNAVQPSGHARSEAAGRDVSCIQNPPARSCVWSQQEGSPGAGDPARSGASTGSIEAQGSGGAIGWMIQGSASKNDAVFRGAVKARLFERTRWCGPRRRSSLRTVQRPIGREDQDDVRISPHASLAHSES